MSKPVLVTGASGYVATRLIPALLERGYKVRCLVRSPEKLKHRLWLQDVEIVTGDVLEAATLQPAVSGIQTVFYLIHNMASGKKYRDNERAGAIHFGRAARESGVENIIFLGGLGGSQKNRHMKSRQETGQLLRESGVAVTEFRSSVILGSGSISFELIRFLATWLPVIPAPRQTFQPGQPIGIRDLLRYLLWAIDEPSCRGQIYEIGGPEVMAYPKLMQEFARRKGISRPLLPLPIFPIPFSARIADWLTPVPYAIAYPLMEELEAPSTVAKEEKVWERFSGTSKLSIKESIAYAMDRQEYLPDSPWTSAILPRQPLDKSHVTTSGDGFYIDYREISMDKASSINFTVLMEKLPKDWKIDIQKDREWIRLIQAKGLFGKLYLEIQLKNGKIMQSVFFDPSGIPGLLWWLVSRYYYLNKLNRFLAGSVDSPDS